MVHLDGWRPCAAIRDARIVTDRAAIAAAEVGSSRWTVPPGPGSKVLHRKGISSAAMGFCHRATRPGLCRLQQTSRGNGGGLEARQLGRQCGGAALGASWRFADRRGLGWWRAPPPAAARATKAYLHARGRLLVLHPAVLQARNAPRNAQVGQQHPPAPAGEATAPCSRRVQALSQA